MVGKYFRLWKSAIALGTLLLNSTRNNNHNDTLCDGTDNELAKLIFVYCKRKWVLLQPWLLVCSAKPNPAFWIRCPELAKVPFATQMLLQVTNRNLFSPSWCRWTLMSLVAATCCHVRASTIWYYVPSLHRLPQGWCRQEATEDITDLDCPRSVQSTCPFLSSLTHSLLDLTAIWPNLLKKSKIKPCYNCKIWAINWRYSLTIAISELLGQIQWHPSTWELG